MKKIFFLIFIAVTYSYTLHAAERFVTKLEDSFTGDTLRYIMAFACDHPGDDIIRFDFENIDTAVINLRESLIIPEDCQGSIEIVGHDEIPIVIDAYNLEPVTNTQPGEQCSFIIYGDGHTLRHLNFFNRRKGAGLCIFGNNNKIIHNNFGRETGNLYNSSFYGIVISDVFARTKDRQFEHLTAQGNKIAENIITNQYKAGLIIEGNETTLENNAIVSNWGTGIDITGQDSIIRSNTIMGNGGCHQSEEFDKDQECLGATGKPGILIHDANHILIGGPNYLSDHNVIQYNGGGALDVIGDSYAITITHNVLSNNYGTMLGVDLNDDGISLNDSTDEDDGPNQLLNYLDHFQSFPLVDGPHGQKRYFAWGLSSPDANRLEIYKVSLDDINRNVSYGGGHEYIQDQNLEEERDFFINPENIGFEPGQWLTTLSFDINGNTSEFSLNTPVGPDTDMDGIPDAYETGNSDEGSLINETDTDGDGLPDSVEDKNKNGKWEPELGETCAYKADSDEDGMNDWEETHGDGIYNEGKDTDPLGSDSDGDGLLDGEEDTNGNGVWDGYLGETSALLADSDGDGVSDALDNCPMHFNVRQDPGVCGANL